MMSIKVESFFEHKSLINFEKGEVMDPQVSEENVPSYKTVEEKIRQIDNTIIIVRTYYIIENLSFTFRFQLIKKDKICMVDIPGKLLTDLKNKILASEQELTDILNSH
ncbi:MAG: hypothetical protein KAJ59_02250, partial [Thermodesulfovibrionia bacterium]|nr:hypothetical protein [Thermodesulfovibrionia bacterium]